jgi:hypothetical protein
VNAPSAIRSAAAATIPAAMTFGDRFERNSRHA